MTGDAVAGPALGAGWAVVAAVAATSRLHRRQARRPSAASGTGTARDPVTASTVAASRRHQSLVAVLGASLHRAAAAGGLPDGSDVGGGAPMCRSDGGHAPHRDAAADRRAGWAVLAGMALLVVAPPLAPVPVACALAAPALAARRERARSDAQLVDQLPDVVDLLALTTAAGLPVGASLLALGARPGGPLGVVVAQAGALLRHGGTTAEALALLSTAGAPARQLVEALVQHDRYGTPLLSALDRVGLEARARRRRRSEEAARRLPVTLLFPLVLTTFPAFVLLTVVPLLAGSLGSLSLTSP